MIDFLHRAARRFGPFVLEEASGQLLRDGRPVLVPPKVFVLLRVFTRKPGRLLTKTQLLEAAWPGQDVGESVIKTAIHELRAVLEDDPAHPRYIETVPRRGYRFMAAVAVATEPGSPPASPWKQVEAGDGLVGRARHVEQLSSAWAHACQGQSKVVFVVGEAGVGKTTLIHHLVQQAAAPTVRGQCVEQGAGNEPYMPWLDALDALCLRHPDVLQALHACAPTWLAQMPWHLGDAQRQALRVRVEGAGQGRMLREIAALLDRLAAAQPLLLVLEDLQWSDRATLQLIEHLASGARASRWLLVASMRPDESGHAAADLQARLRLRGLADGMQVAPFTVGEVADYLAQRLAPEPVPGGLATKLHAQTGGLPLYLALWLDAAQEQQGGRTGPARAMLHLEPGRLPQALAHMMELQLALLSQGDLGLLEAAAVLGVEFPSRPLARMLGQPWLGTRAHLDRLARQGRWLVPVSVERLADGHFEARHAFRHALHRQLLYQRLGEADRAELHGRAAAALEASATEDLASAAELAEHHERSHALEAAVRYGAQGVRVAMQRFAPHEAARLAAHALALLDRCEGMACSERDRLALALRTQQGMALAQGLGFAAAEREHALQQARALGERMGAVSEHGWIYGGLGWIQLAHARYASAQEMADRVEALVLRFEDPALAVCALNLRGVALSCSGAHAQAVAAMRHGLALCQSAADRIADAPFTVDPTVSMLANAALPLLALGDIAAAARQVAQARARAATLGTPMALMVAAWAASMLGAALGEPNRVLEALPALEAAARQHEIGQAEGPSQWYAGWALAMAGKMPPRQALAQIRAGQSAQRARGMVAGASLVHLYAAQVALQGAELDDARMEIDEGIRCAAHTGEAMQLAPLYLASARWHAVQRDAARAQEDLGRALQQSTLQQAAWPAFEARLACCELSGAGPAERAELAHALSRLRGGEGHALVRRARRLLQ